jgi:hypothetical protein
MKPKAIALIAVFVGAFSGLVVGVECAWAQ